MTTTTAVQLARRPTSLDRAIAAGKMPARHPSGLYYLIESSTHAGQDHAMTVRGESISCSCLAGTYGEPTCLHRAALRYCLAQGVLGVYALCANCGSTRVPKVGGWCSGCANLRTSVIEQERPATLPTSVLPFPASDPCHARQRSLTLVASARCAKCQGDSRDPLHDTYCA